MNDESNPNSVTRELQSQDSFTERVAKANPQEPESTAAMLKAIGTWSIETKMIVVSAIAIVLYAIVLIVFYFMNSVSPEPLVKPIVEQPKDTITQNLDEERDVESQNTLEIDEKLVEPENRDLKKKRVKFKIEKTQEAENKIDPAIEHLRLQKDAEAKETREIEELNRLWDDIYKNRVSKACARNLYLDNEQTYSKEPKHIFVKSRKAEFLRCIQSE